MNPANLVLQIVSPLCEDEPIIWLNVDGETPDSQSGLARRRDRRRRRIQDVQRDFRDFVEAFAAKNAQRVVERAERDKIGQREPGQCRRGGKGPAVAGASS